MVLPWSRYFEQLESSAAFEALDAGFSGKVVAALARLPSSRRRGMAEPSRSALRRATGSTFCSDAERHGGGTVRAE